MLRPLYELLHCFGPWRLSADLAMSRPDSESSACTYVHLADMQLCINMCTCDMAVQLLWCVFCRIFPRRYPAGRDSCPTQRPWRLLLIPSDTPSLLEP